MRAPPSTRSAQRGVAVVTALLLTTLAVTIVASLFWQQQVQVRTIENQHLQLQKQWLMRGALDWASMILRAGGRQSSVDYVGQPWSTPLADTRLDQYAEDAQSGSDAVLSGNIVDAQSRYNLNNLGANGVVNAAELAVFKRLLGNLGLPASLAAPVAQAIAAGQSSAPQMAANARTGTLPMLQVDDLLSLPGFTPDMVRQLKDFVVLLPVATQINANTAAAEVLAARFETLSLAQANTLIASRRSAPFLDMANLSAQMKQLFGRDFTDTANVALSSNYFLVNGKIRIGRAALKTLSLIQRTNNRSATDIVWIREQ